MAIHMRGNTRICDKTHPDDLNMMKKYTSTQMPEEGFYNNSEVDDFMRASLCNWGAEEGAVMEADLPRRNVAAATGILNLREGGSRGEADLPWSSESFMGDVEHDPRGWRDGVDMSRARAEHQHRGRYQRMGTDTASEWAITSGERGEHQKRRDFIRANQLAARRIKTFRGSITADPYTVKPILIDRVSVENYIVDRSRVGEAILKNIAADTSGSSLFKGRAVNQARSKGYAIETLTSDMQIMKYNVGGRQVKGAAASGGQRDGVIGGLNDRSRLNVARKAGVLMALASGARTSANVGDVDVAESNMQDARKLGAAISASLSTMPLNSGDVDYDDAGEGGAAARSKRMRVSRRDGSELARDGTEVSVLAEMMFNAVRVAARSKGAARDGAGDLAESGFQAPEAANRRRGKIKPLISGRDGVMVVDGVSMITANYKGMHARTQRGTNGNYEHDARYGRNKEGMTRDGGRKTADHGAGAEHANFAQIDYVDNDAAATRLGGRFGTKGTIRREHDDDHAREWSQQ